MQLKPEEISKVIRSQIKYYQNAIEQSETGTVLIVGDGIARVSGLTNCMSGELLEFEDGTFGMAQNLEENSVSIVIFGSDENIGEGQTVKRTGKVVSVPVGDAMVGRVVNALGQPIDGAGPIDTKEFRPIESKAPGICERRSVYQPLQTGIKAIDSMIPIGRGQRELIIGDRQTGKTSIATDTIINQRGKDVICIYVAIGQKASTVAKIVNTLKKHGAKTENILVKTVPGSFELTFGANQMMENCDVDAIIIIGCVIKGDTPHFDYVCMGVTQGVAQLNATGDIPVIYGLITTNTMEQAEDRAGGKLGNKGDECAITAIKMIDFVWSLNK